MDFLNILMMIVTSVSLFALVFLIVAFCWLIYDAIRDGEL